MPIYNAPILAVDPGETRRYAGLQKAEEFKEELIDNACQEAQLLIQPQGIWQIYDYDAASQTIYTAPRTKDTKDMPPISAKTAGTSMAETLPGELPAMVRLQGKSIGRHLQKACKVVVLSATIGEDIENQVTRSFEEGRYSFSVLLDAAATTAIEEVADGMEKNIFSVVKRQGLAMTWRFSPGYGDWPIEQQPEVLSLAHGEKIGVSLTEALMLTPRKSITAVIGLYYPDKDCEKTSNKHDCSQCAKTDCPARRS